MIDASSKIKGIIENTKSENIVYLRFLEMSNYFFLALLRSNRFWSSEATDEGSPGSWIDCG